MATRTDAPAALSLDGIRAGYGSIEVLHDVSLTVPRGHVVALLGPNGAGKTTTLNVACGLHRAASGQVSVNGVSTDGTSAERLARTGLCAIPEGRGVFPNLSVRENLRMVTYAGTAMATVEERAYQRFPRLKERRHQAAGTLSGGEQQMLAMSRALATQPTILLLDELSMGLAPLVVEELYGIVSSLAADGISILVVEQFVHTVLAVADSAAVMVHGQIVTTGSPADVSASLADVYLGR
jgi:branched-chain amino acid transport system ATP-binding protein